MSLRLLSLLFVAFTSGLSALAAPTSALESQPLEPRSGPRGATMFKLLAPTDTGVVTENRYADPRMWTDHYQELAYGEIGTGVAIGDYDRDGRPDIFVVSKTEPCRLFRNLGHWKFEDVSARAGLLPDDSTWSQSLAWVRGKLGAGAAAPFDPAHWQQGATFADVNNDGWLDLYVCRFGAPNLLYINQHDGTFKEEAAARGLALADASGMAAFCDYDRDGWLDVYIHTSLLDATTHPNGQRDHLFHNNRDGTFTDVSASAGIAGETAAHSATWWDYDGDGWPDLYVADDYAPPDHLYHNNRNGTFTDVLDQVVPHTPYYGMGADLGDVNNDGLVDLFVADMAPTTREKDQRGMAGSRARAQDAPADPTKAAQIMRNALYLNTGTGVCLEAAQLAGLAATDWTWSPRFEDLDNDGRLDLHVTNGMTREYHNADLLDRIMAAESPLESRRMMKSAPPLAERNLAFRNLGDLRFEDVSAAWGLDQRGVSFGSAFGDFDGDGDLDLVYANYLGGVSLLRNDSDTGHRLIVALRGTHSNRFGIGSLVRLETDHGVQVRPLVLARGVLSSSEPVAHFGLGEETLIRRLTVTWPDGGVQVFENLPADRRIVITEPSAGSAPAASAPALPMFEEITAASGLGVAPLAGGDEPATTPLLGFRPDWRAPALVVGHVGRDQHETILLGGAAGGRIRRLDRVGGQAAFVPAALPPEFPASEGPMLAADIDGDGRDDLVIATARGLDVWLADGAGSFRRAPAFAVARDQTPVGALATADVDRDGRLDVFVGGGATPGAYPVSAPSQLLLNRGTGWEDATDRTPGLSAAGLVRAAMWTDLDQDGWPDLVVAVEWGPIRCWHNRAGHGFEDWTETAGFAQAGTGWWRALAAVDLNGDGRPDIVAGNLGLNTRYRATPAHPVRLYRGDLGGRGTFDLETFQEDGHEYPWITRQELASLLPDLVRRFPRNDLYARATLDDLVSPDRLKTAQVHAATEFRSGVFLSQPDGTYRFTPLPRIAQIAPIEDLAAADFDGDGLADLYAVQNSFAPVASVGRFDGGVGQLLRGDGRGGLEPVPPATSGLVVRGDAKAAVVLDIDHDGRPDLLIARRGAPMVVYRTRSPSGGRMSRAH
jgi:hypothetical protein